ncbi:hypothetical protein V5T82_10990 [Magnetovibrio sp. PR-2]|uniref:Bbp19 family protein n=1 Tax=Magnetovibrio sp. PR-2 TaxID=3120356 RepID=UPI002FCE4C75
MSTQTSGWAWFERFAEHEDEVVSAQAEQEIRLAYARCFSSPDGQRVLEHLRSMTLERAMGPNVSAEHLRHIEGQRQLVSTIEQLTQRGRQGD